MADENAHDTTRVVDKKNENLENILIIVLCVSLWCLKLLLLNNYLGDISDLPCWCFCESSNDLRQRMFIVHCVNFTSCKSEGRNCELDILFHASSKRHRWRGTCVSYMYSTYVPVYVYTRKDIQIFVDTS